MQYQRFGDRYQLRFASGEPLMETLLRFLRVQGVGYGSLTGLGALSRATISYWHATTQQYEAHEIDEQVELVSLVGNASIKNEVPFVHAHATLGRSDLSVIGGHFNEATVHPNAEIWLRPEPETVRRTLDDASGLYLMDLPERL
jgi:uncharacterized protein